MCSHLICTSIKPQLTLAPEMVSPRIGSHGFGNREHTNKQQTAYIRWGSESGALRNQQQPMPDHPTFVVIETIVNIIIAHVPSK